jgi:hypothetical protein
MTRALLLTLVAAMPAAAAAVRGTVVENYTGKLLSRALVVLEAMPGTPGGVRTVRTNRFGAFGFSELAAGVYVLKASRRGFMPIEHGQKRWNSAGVPMVLEETAAPYVTLRLPRYSAVSGTVVDENEIGLPGHDVAVFRATQPPEHVRDAVADDRGVYRVGGLEPGKYFVRTVGKQYEDGGYLPTYSRETVRADQAQVVEVLPEAQADRVDVRPLPGKVFSVFVRIFPDDDPDIVLTVASANGRKSVKAAAATFSGLSPGDFEIYAESPTVNSYQRLSLREDMKVDLIPLPFWRVTVSGGPAAAAKLRVRRKDLAAVGPEFVVPLPDGAIPPGRWELLLEPPDGYYVSSTTPYGVRGRVDGWIEVTSRPNLNFGYRLTTGAGSIRGVVKEGGYAPVYVEGYDSRLRQRAGDLKAVRADARGNYSFSNLAPGVYRVVSTYEYLMPSTELIDSMSPVTVTLGPASDATKELDLWVIR